MRFTSHFTGFYGQSDLTGVPNSVGWRLGKPKRPFAEESGVIQWLHPACAEEEPLLHLLEGQLFLAGLVWLPEGTFQSMGNAINTAIENGEYDKLATTSDNAAGCFIRNDGMIYLWTGYASKDTIFFRVDSPLVRWSTNPLDLIETEAEIDLWALRRCCYADDVSIYPTLGRVEQGHLIIIHRDRGTTTHQFDRFLPDPVLSSRRARLHDFLGPTRDALRQAVQPLYGEKVGILCSGGPGSAALLAALKEVGIETIAYHLESPDPAGSEYGFARLLCDALNIPLQRIMMDTDATYLSPDWVFAHPYGHPWGRWYEQAALAARSDHISLLVTGGGDDSAFGPGLSYGLHSILFARIARREKIRMVRCLLSTDWNMFDILGSLAPNRQIIGPSSLAGVKKEDREWRRADFLTPLPPRPRTWDDGALQHAPCFSPQAMALEQAILQPNGIRLYNPYHQRSVQAISLALPNAYKLTPNLFAHRAPADRIIDKPVLRLAFDDLPAKVIWRGWSVWTQAACQQFCLSQKELLRVLLGEDSYLTALNITDPSRLSDVLGNRVTIRENYKTLIASAVVELYLRNALHPHLRRGGPPWK